MNNADNNEKQRRPGGATGKGFKPGQSGNLKGRPRAVRGLMVALKEKLAEKSDDGKNYEQRLVDVLIEECLKGRNRVAAIQNVFDRVIGKVPQQVTTSDQTRALEALSPEAQLYYATHGRLPDSEQN